MDKILAISLMLNSTLNTLGCYGFKLQSRLNAVAKHCEWSFHGKKGFVILTKSFVKIGITKTFCYNNKMFSSINKTLVAAVKFLVAATKILSVVPNFVAVTKPFFPCTFYFFCLFSSLEKA